MLATDKSLRQLLVNKNSNEPTEQTDIFKMVSLSFNKNLSDDLAISCTGGGCGGCGSGPSPGTEDIFQIISFTSANLQADNLLSGLECAGSCGGCNQCNILDS